MRTIWAVQELASFFQAKTANEKLASTQKTCTVPLYSILTSYLKLRLYSYIKSRPEKSAWKFCGISFQGCLFTVINYHEQTKKTYDLIFCSKIEIISTKTFAHF